MRTKLCASLLACLTACVAACGNDNGGPRETPDAGSSCSIEASYTSIHANLLSGGRCAIAGCHVTATMPENRGGLDFSAGKDAVYEALLNGGTFTVAAQAAFPDRVVASDSGASYLYEKVSKAMPAGGGTGRMPPGIALADCEIQAIESWISGGAAND